MLTDHGLGAAVRALTLRCPLPVEPHDELAQRLAPPLETALYYTVAEALTNVVRYADASHATVRIAGHETGVELEIRDDGRGGADRTRGTGLRGLEDRLATVGGRLELESAAGRGTRLRVRVPLR